MTNSNSTHERPIWLSLLLGFVVWFLYFNLVYPLTSLTCRWGWFQFNILGMPGLRFIQLVLTVITLLLIGSFIYLPWHNWLRAEAGSDKEDRLHQTSKDPRSLMALVSMLLNSLFGLFVIATFIPIFALNPCG